MTVQNYYARRTAWRREAVDVDLALNLVRAEREQQPRLGGRKLYYMIAAELKAAGVKMGRDRLFEELRKVGMLVERKPSEWPKTTHFDAHLPVFKTGSRASKSAGATKSGWLTLPTFGRGKPLCIWG